MAQCVKFKSLAISRVMQTCSLIGTLDETARPPPEAVAAVEKLLIQFTNASGADETQLSAKTRINAILWEDWHSSAKDPDDQIFPWLTQGAPAGILSHPLDARIFPDRTPQPDQSIHWSASALPSGTLPTSSGCDKIPAGACCVSHGKI